jgi:protein-S-isoprenylcysteine O-methyltransferase Ste14
MLVPLGGAVALSARMRFSRAGTDVRPWKPSRSIVTEGVYRLTRNPMYLGLTLAYLGLAGAFSSVAALAILPLLLAYIQIAVIAREERYLAAKFGDAYRDYTSRVRRWI